MKREDMKILIGCEESQRVVSEWRRRGFEAYSCDLLPCSGGHPEWHIMGDVASFVDGHCKFRTMDGVEHEVEGEWSLIIAHPPCTYFSTAGACRLFHHGELDKARYKKGLKMRRLFMKCLNAKCKYVSVENPTPMSIWKLPQHSQVIQPWMFKYVDENGETQTEPHKKRTLLWLKNLPHLVPQILEQPKNVQRWVNAGMKVKGVRVKDTSHACSAKERSKTFKGIAYQMAE